MWLGFYRFYGFNIDFLPVAIFMYCLLFRHNFVLSTTQILYKITDKNLFLLYFGVNECIHCFIFFHMVTFNSSKHNIWLIGIRDLMNYVLYNLNPLTKAIGYIFRQHFFSKLISNYNTIPHSITLTTLIIEMLRRYELTKIPKPRINNVIN